MKLRKRAALLLLAAICFAATLICCAPLPIASAESEQWTWPVPGSFYIWSLDYYYDGSFHSQGQAIDIGNNGYNGAERLDIVSATSGVVVRATNSYGDYTNPAAGFGNCVAVEYKNLTVVYAHLKSVYVKIGQAVSPGTVLGKMGQSGFAYGVHLHFQVYPTGTGSRDTTYKAFDFFKSNPDYIPRFSFQPGTAECSRCYASYLAKYFSRGNDGITRYNGAALPKHNHTWGAWKKLNDTQHTRVCLLNPAHTETANHTWGKETVIRAATPDADGAARYTCTACGATKTAVLPKTSFTVFYHIDETAAPAAESTRVEYGSVGARLRTVSELGFSRPGFAFAGWRMYRACDDKWFVLNAEGAMTWVKSSDGTLPEGDTYVLMKDGNALSKAAPTGEVHVYAQWQPALMGAARWQEGDVDNDGSITAIDARLVLRCSVSLDALGAAAVRRGDLDGDGVLSAADARLILRNSVGLDD